MNELIKVSENEKQQQVVSARDLHEVLGITKRFSAWWQDQCERLNLEENVDYCTSGYTNTNNQEFADYHVMMDIAKHLSMVSGGEKAKAVRQYFIEVERAWNDPDQVFARALQMANRTIENFKVENIKLTQEIEYKSDVINGLVETVDVYTMRTILNRVVKHKGADYRERYSELYKVFREQNGIDLKARCEGHNLKLKVSKQLSVIKYAEQFGHIENLYNVAVKLYETDVNEILKDFGM